MLNLNHDCTDDASIMYETHTSYSSIRDDNTIEVFDMEEERMEYRGIPIPKITTKVDKSRYTPVTILMCDTIATLQSRRMLKVLFDSGSTRTLINRDCLPANVQTKSLEESKTFKTLAGELKTTEVVTMRDIKLPEFSRNRTIDSQKALVFNSPCRYDVILGADFLTKTGINLNYAEGELQWYHVNVPMKDPLALTKDDYLAMIDVHLIEEDDEVHDEWFETYVVAPIKDAKYEAVDVDDVVQQQTHLTDEQRNDLNQLLKKYTRLFSGKLGLYPHRKVHIDLIEGAEAKHCKPYPVPHVHYETFKKELEHLVRLGVLIRQGTSEWASPSFIIPKKDGTVRWVSDLRQLNKVIKRKVYPLPVITDILKRRTGYAYFTKLDLSMQYFTFELDEESANLCTIITPFGKYKYNRLPMGLKCSPDIAQEAMENVLHGIDDTEVYLDDIGVFSKTWQDHLKVLEKVLNALEVNGFTVNPLKCEWAVKETDWLGYWLTPTGIKPWKKKIDGILKMQPPKNLKELRGFIGAVNYYRDMWPKRAQTLKPLTDKSGAKKFEWTQEMNKAYEAMRAMIVAETLLTYPNHNKPFDIYTDASDYQMGACIMQEGKPVAHWSRKLTGAQRNYTTMEKELLSIVEVLREFRGMLLGAELRVHTDHKNLTFHKLNTQRVLRWRCFIEEYSPQLIYIKGEKNVIADTYSRLERNDDVDVSTTPPEIDDMNYLYEDNELLECYLQIPECYLNIPEMTEGAPGQSPLVYQWIREHQEACQELQQMKNKFPNQYREKQFPDNVRLTVHVKHGENPETQWKIALSRSMLQPTIKWYHEMLGHPGSKRLCLSLQARYYHPQLRSFVDKYTCETCKKYKLDGRGYGLLNERDVNVAPWDEVAIDLIGPWTIEINNQKYEFNALTCIDPVSNLVELIRIDNKTAKHVRRKFEQAWLARYPLPKRCIHDNGGEFTGYEFQRILARLNIKDVPTTSRNPQSNAICERMHQTVGNILRTLLHTTPPTDVENATELIDEALSTAMHAMRTTVATALGASPGALVFARDMFLDIPLIAEWQTIASRREQIVNESLRRQNAKRRSYDYVIGQNVYKKMVDPSKLGRRVDGPYRVRQVHTNGNITIELRQGVTERINIRRVIPADEEPQ